MREFEIKPHLDKILQKLRKKDAVAYKVIFNKIKEIVTCDDVEHYKNLQNKMKDKKRVHLMSHFVLIFSYDKRNDFVSFLDYDHHDNVYR